MGKFLFRFGRTVGFATSILLISVSSLSGCQLATPLTAQRILRHQALIDFAGLRDAVVINELNAGIATPVDWDASVLKKGALYTHQQWKSPTRTNAVGIIFIRMPIPLSARAIEWFAKNEYTKRGGEDGKLIGEWTDALGRPWFEAENNKYHCRGCVMVRGNDAWLLYCGYRRDMPARPDEVMLAARSLESIVPADVQRQKMYRVASSDVVR
jgi:hypothetical protein